jgi:hypothetical protein
LKLTSSILNLTGAKLTRITWDLNVSIIGAQPIDLTNGWRKVMEIKYHSLCSWIFSTMGGLSGTMEMLHLAH